MSLDIAKFKNINELFGDVIGKMKNDPLNYCLKNDRKKALTNFDKMLSYLTESNVDQLVDGYIKKGIKDQSRIYSLISEIRAGSYLSCMNFPVEYIKEGDGKTPDIKTSIIDRRAFVEVKRISERRFEYTKLLEEFKKYNIQYDVELYFQTVIFSATDVINEIKKNVPDKLTKLYTKVPFKYGEFKIRQMNYKKPLFLPTISYRVPGSKNEKEQSNDSYISREEVEGGIIADLDDALSKFDEYCRDSDLYFVFLDDIDVHSYGHPELRNLLYGGKQVGSIVKGKFIAENCNPVPEASYAHEKGWKSILRDLKFFPAEIDYSEKKGWYLYHEGTGFLNGVFHISAHDFSVDEVYCFLNPFIMDERNVPELENVLEYYHG